MLTNRDRRRFQQVAARAMRPSGRGSFPATLGRLSTRSLLALLTIVSVAVALAGFYASREALEPRSTDLALRGKPAAAPEAIQETQPARPTESAQPAATESRQVQAPDVRQAHLRQLQPVLRAEAERMSQVARRTRAAGRMASDPRSYFAAHRVLSPDLPNHYPEYAEAKERLRKTVTDQEEEYQQTVQLVTSKLSLPPVAEARRAEIAGALLERCLAKGPGMTLTTRSDGYQYTVPGRTQRYSGGTAVAEDEGAAFAAFTAFVPEPDMVARCESLKKRAAGIVSNAEKLSADALVLAEQTTLPGECKYTKSE